MTETENLPVENSTEYFAGMRSVNLKPDFTDQILSQIQSLEGTPHQPTNVHYYSTYHGIYSWLRLYFNQDKVFNEERLARTDFRGYLMVEPENMEEALRIMLKVAAKREDKGKALFIKLLTRRSYDRVSPSEVESFGEYKDLDITDPRMVIYGDSPDELRDVMEDVVREGWGNIERTRKRLAKGVKRGNDTNYFTDRKGRVWQSLNWNDFYGSTESRASL